MSMIDRLKKGKEKFEEFEEVIGVVIAVYTITIFGVKKYKKHNGTLNLEVQETK